jgi:hypothetical protein
LILYSTDLNTAPLRPALLSQSAQPYNVDTVIVDGRILKRNRQLTSIDVTQVVREATEAQRDLWNRAIAK